MVTAVGAPAPQPGRDPREILARALFNLLMARQEAEMLSWREWLEYRAFLRWRADHAGN